MSNTEHRTSPTAFVPRDPDFEARVCRAFHEALRPADRDLLFVLDQLEVGDVAGFSPDGFAVIRDRCEAPPARRSA